MTSISKEYKYRKKYKRFVEEPIDGKKVTALPGIGHAKGKKLADKEYPEASDVLKKFLELKEDKKAMRKWLEEEFGVYKNHAKHCASSLKDYCDARRKAKD